MYKYVQKRVYKDLLTFTSPVTVLQSAKMIVFCSKVSCCHMHIYTTEVLRLLV